MLAGIKRPESNDPGWTARCRDCHFVADEAEYWKASQDADTHVATSPGHHVVIAKE